MCNHLSSPSAPPAVVGRARHDLVQVRQEAPPPVAQVLLRLQLVVELPVDLTGNWSETTLTSKYGGCSGFRNKVQQRLGRLVWQINLHFYLISSTFQKIIMWFRFTPRGFPGSLPPPKRRDCWNFTVEHISQRGIQNHLRPPLFGIF